MPSENGLSRREELLAVATKLFAARGYHGTRMDDVADVVGLNKATVYHYYASKSLILYDIYQQAAERTLAAVHDDPSMSAREALYQYTVRLLTGSPANPEGAAVYFQEQPYITEWFTEEQVAAVREKETQVYEHVHGLIDRGIASGEFYRMRLARPGARLHRDDARRLPVAAAERTPQRQGDRRRVQYRTAAGSDPRRDGPERVTARGQNRNRYSERSERGSETDGHD